MVTIRLSRFGRKNRPYWRVVVLDSRSKRDGACLETLGSYDPLHGTIARLHLDRIEAWVSKGAQCSESVTKLIRKYKRESQSPASLGALSKQTKTSDASVSKNTPGDEHAEDTK